MQWFESTGLAMPWLLVNMAKSSACLAVMSLARPRSSLAAWRRHPGRGSSTRLHGLEQPRSARRMACGTWGKMHILAVGRSSVQSRLRKRFTSQQSISCRCVLLCEIVALLPIAACLPLGLSCPSAGSMLFCENTSRASHGTSFLHDICSNILEHNVQYHFYTQRTGPRLVAAF
jgi:hypothetical protein